MKIGTVVFSGLLGTCGTLAWMGRSSEGYGMDTRGSEGLVLKDHGIDARETAAAMHSRDPSSTSECESQMVSTLKLTCHDTEAQRIGVSIALTLCSISSARQQPPTECNAWSSFGVSGDGMEKWKEMPGGGMRDVDRRGRCLEALHRSPQDWSSYNGFLGNAMQLCHALHGRQQEEFAKSVYANISQEKMDLLRYLKRNDELRMLDQEQVQQAFQARIQDLGNLHESTKLQHDTLATIISSSSDSANQAHARLLQTIVEMRNVGEGWWEDVKLRAQEQVDLDAANAKQAMHMQLSGMRSLLEKLSNEVAEKQRQEMLSLSVQHRSHIDEVWTREQSHVAEFVQELVSMTGSAAGRIQDVDLHISRLSQHLEDTSGLAIQLSPMLEQALGQSRKLHSLQLAEENTTRQNLDLASIMNDKLIKTLEIAESSNVALEDLREEITRRSHMGFPFWRYVELAGTFLPYFSSPTFTALKAQPFVSPLVMIMSTVGNLLFNVLAFAFYSITTVWVVFRTGIWRLARRAGYLLYSEYQALRQEQFIDIEYTPKKPTGQASQRTTDIYRIKPRNPGAPAYPASRKSTLQTTRKPSFGRQLDDMTRRAQSEPLL